MALTISYGFNNEINLMKAKIKNSIVYKLCVLLKLFTVIY